MDEHKVIIILGSQSDIDYIKPAIDIFNHFGIKYDVRISSAHRTPERTVKLAKSLKDEGYKIVIAAAGLSAHLPGVISSNTDLPVLGIPLPTGYLKGIDALLSINQMPSGVPVATMSIGENGAINSALLAIRILALGDENLQEKMKKYREEQEEKIIKEEKKLLNSLNK